MGAKAFQKKYGPWALITGASSGIGEAMAFEAARRRLNVVLTARSEARMADISVQLKQTYGVETRVIVADLAKASGVDAVTGQTAELDIGLLANCAGFGTSGDFVDIPAEDELDMIDVNCRASAALTHVFSRRFIERGRGGVILMSSIVAFQGVARSANYAATKAWVQVFAEGLRMELAPRRIDVLAVAPGPVNSGFAARAGMQMGGAARPVTIARGAFAALGRTGLVRPGALAKLLGYNLAILPRFARRRIMSTIMKGMTRHRNGDASKA